jgi:hypothetical protein
MKVILKYHPAEAAAIAQKRQQIIPIINQIGAFNESLVLRSGYDPIIAKLVREGANEIELEVPDPPTLPAPEPPAPPAPEPEAPPTPPTPDVPPAE